VVPATKRKLQEEEEEEELRVLLVTSNFKHVLIDLSAYKVLELNAEAGKYLFTKSPNYKLTIAFNQFPF